MKIRTKILLITLPILLLAIGLINFTFNRFFNDYLENQETAQINSDLKSIEQYIQQTERKYMSTVKDWAQWDDTFFFIMNYNDDFVQNNLKIDDIATLDIHFMMFLNNKNELVFYRLFDPYKHIFVEPGAQFLSDFNKMISTFQDDQIASILKLSSDYYFVAASEVTDSNQIQKTNGKLFIGRKIDESMIKELENSAGCTLKNIKTGLPASQNKNSRIMLDSKGKNPDSLFFDIAVNNHYDANASVIFSFSKQRDLFNSGMKQYNSFVIVNLLFLAFIAAVVFFLLRIFIVKPIIALTNEVKSIDLSSSNGNRVKEYGSYEFKFLQKSINYMFDKIETEQARVKSSEEKLYATLFSVGDGVIAVDKENKIEFLNPVAEKLTGWPQQQAIGKNMETVFNIINEYTREKTENPALMVFELEKIIELANHTLLIAKDGTEKAIEDTAAPIKDKKGNIVGCVIVFRDFSEKKEKQRRIEYLSYHDQLTGLYNRRFFDEELKRLDKKRNLPISMVYADVNGLKTINDAFGHLSGDKLISTVANVFMTECRGDDIIARIGGDEFVIILPKTDQVATENLVKRIKNRVSSKKIANIYISISFGCDTKTAETQSVREILKNAENQMYKKKILENSSKKNTVIRSILNTLKIKAPREGFHSQRVSVLCEDIGKAFNLNEDDIIELKAAGELHDIGKIAVDEAILNKSTALSESEWAHIKSHPEIGYRLLSNSYEFHNLAEYVLAHHERWDGTGYPKGLSGKAINWKSRIIAVADAYDAMTSNRPYHKALSTEEAIAELKQNAGKQFDPDIVRVFIEKVLDDTAVNI